METGYKPYFDPNFETLIDRMHAPRVCVDNESCKQCTVVKVDSANRYGILLEMVQVLTDFDLLISKSYISSDGGWLMDVFHVTDRHGNKITEDNLSTKIEQALAAARGSIRSTDMRWRPRMADINKDFTTLEISAPDRPGLLSEILAVLLDMNCDILNADAWTHRQSAAAVIYMVDDTSCLPITDTDRLAKIQDQIANVVIAHCGTGEKTSVRLICPPAARVHTDRRLHQLMSTVQYCEEDDATENDGNNGRIEVSIDSWAERDYAIVNVKSRDRPKLLFDTVCTLTDMNYVVFHAAIASQCSLAVQEYYIRRLDGRTLESMSERQRVARSLVAALQRRVPHGLRMDVCTPKRRGLLADITRAFRENGLAVTKVDIRTSGGNAVGCFYVTDSSGKHPSPDALDLVISHIGPTVLTITSSPSTAIVTSVPNARPIEGNIFSLLGNEPFLDVIGAIFQQLGITKILRWGNSSPLFSD